MGGRQRLARGLGKRQAQRGFGGWSGVGKPRERRRRAGQVAKFLAGGQGQAAACTRGIRRVAFSLAARRPSTASSRRDRSACVVRLAASSAASLASSGARFGGCRCSSAVRRLSSGARSGAGAAPPCGGGRCSRAVTRALSGPRSGICGCGRCSSRVTRASSALSCCARASVCCGSGRRNGGMPPDPDQPGRQDQESGGGQRGETGDAAAPAPRSAALAARLPGPAAGRSVHSSQQREHRVLVRLSGDAGPPPGELL